MQQDENRLKKDKYVNKYVRRKNLKCKFEIDFNISLTYCDGKNDGCLFVSH